MRTLTKSISARIKSVGRANLANISIPRLMPLSSIVKLMITVMIKAVQAIVDGDKNIESPPAPIYVPRKSPNGFKYASGSMFVVAGISGLVPSKKWSEYPRVHDSM